MLRLIAALPVLLATGCYTSFEIDPDDAPVVPLDAGVTPVVDAGPIVPTDAGPPPVDASVCGMIVPPYDGPSCRPETTECLASCEDPDCQSVCFDADPGCGRCLNLSLIHCANREGCQPGWDAVSCCAQEGSPTCREGIARGEIEVCLMECAGPFEAWGVCFEGLGDACPDEATTRCFR